MPETSKTVHHALDVLGHLRAEGPAPAASIAARLGLSRTVVARLLATLQAHDLVRRTGGGFAVGLGVLELAAGVEPRLRDAAGPLLADLADRFQETAVLSVREGTHAVAVDAVVPGERVVRVHYQPGSRHLLTEAAHGRCMLAALAPDDPAAAAAGDLDAVRRVGYATSHDELEPGVSGLAAAVLDGRDVVAAVGVVAPSGRMPAEEELAGAVCEAAARISSVLRGEGRPETADAAPSRT